MELYALFVLCFCFIARSARWNDGAYLLSSRLTPYIDVAASGRVSIFFTVDILCVVRVIQDDFSGLISGAPCSGRPGHVVGKSFRCGMTNIQSKTLLGLRKCFGVCGSKSLRRASQTPSHLGIPPFAMSDLGFLGSLAGPTGSTPVLRRPCESHAVTRVRRLRRCLLCVRRVSADSVEVHEGRLSRCTPSLCARRF